MDPAVFSHPRDVVIRILTHAQFHSKSKIEWECDNGGQLWTESAEDGYGTSASFPSGFCTSGFSSVYAAFVGGLVVDLVFQVRIVPTRVG